MPPSPAVATPPSEIHTLLGRGSTFEGKLSFEGTVRIDGRLTGEIFAEDVLVVGEGAEVKAEIAVGTIIVEGSVEGNIRATQLVELRAPARVRGNIATPQLVVEKGVLFDGQCQMTKTQTKPETKHETKPETKAEGRGEGKAGR